MIQYTVFSIGGKLGEEVLFSDFSDHIFFNGIWETSWIWDGVEGTGGQPPPACPCSYAGHTLPSPGDAGEQASSKFALCQQGEQTVSSSSPQLSPWWQPGAHQGEQCCSALGFILTPYLPHYTLAPSSRWALAPCHRVSSLSTQSSPATMPSSPWLLRVRGGAHTACVAMVASLPWAQGCLGTVADGESLQGWEREGSAPWHCPRTGVAAALTLHFIEFGPASGLASPCTSLATSHRRSASAMLSPRHGDPGGGDVLELPVYCYQTKRR